MLWLKTLLWVISRELKQIWCSHASYEYIQNTIQMGAYWLYLFWFMECAVDSNVYFMLSSCHLFWFTDICYAYKFISLWTCHARLIVRRGNHSKCPEHTPYMLFITNQRVGRRQVSICIAFWKNNIWYSLPVRYIYIYIYTFIYKDNNDDGVPVRQF